jgi:hypothetical protein
MTQLIAQSFVDWQKATINALKSYEAMRHCIDTAGESLLRADDRLYSLKGATTNKEPVQGGGSRPEDAWASAIDHKAVVMDKLGNAKRYMAWFKPAWDKLTEAERIVLYERWIVHRDDRGRWVDSVKARLFIEQSQCYERSAEALERLCMLLYGA